MAAYAALVSLMNTINQIKLHPHPPISLNQIHVESLSDNVIFLQQFLEGYSLHVDHSKEADPLERRIANAAYAAEDVIESHIVDHIRAGSKSKISFLKIFKCLCGSTDAAADHEDDEVSSTLQKVLEDFDLIKKEVMEIQEETEDHDQLKRNPMLIDGALRCSSTGEKISMVGFDDILLDMMNKLTGGQFDRQIIPVVGMGGTGKTTLARNVYENRTIVKHFEFRAWVTISQEYRMREILLELVQKFKLTGEDMSLKNENELGEKLHKELSARRYMIIMDDIWDIEVLDQLRRLCPDNKNGSRIVITTRTLNIELIGSYVFRMRVLDKYESWSLFSKTVFGEEDCPFELKKIGKMIVGKCRGLPLSIVVVGGLLVKSEHTREYWEYVGENLNSIVNSNDDESCLKILYMSYKLLPVYLKPCFLYMGVFSEDRRIRVSELIRLWVAEGFLKSISGKSPEEVASKYFHELINRNLVLVHQLGSTGNIKYCKIHDLLRDLCLRQAGKERFYNVTTKHDPNAAQGARAQRRIVIPECALKEDRIVLQVMSSARSLISDSKRVPPLRNFRLLRITSCSQFLRGGLRKDMFKLVNSRCLVFKALLGFKFPSSFYRLWNLQTLIVGSGKIIAPFNIWNMPQLRHVMLENGFELPNVPSGQDGVLLGNLETLGLVRNFKWHEEVVKIIPNIKKLKVHYMHEPISEKRSCDRYCVNNLGLLHKLESFYCRQNTARRVNYLRNLTFAHSLKKLTLSSSTIDLEDMLEKVGTLPHLEKFKLMYGYFKGGKWETAEGQFCRLKFLSIQWCSGLKYWITESSHFPCLEHLVLDELEELEEFPSEIGEIAALKLIKLVDCSSSLLTSTKEVAVKQEGLCGEVCFQVQDSKKGYKQVEELSRLAHPASFGMF